MINILFIDDADSAAVLFYVNWFSVAKWRHMVS